MSYQKLIVIILLMLLVLIMTACRADEASPPESQTVGGTPKPVHLPTLTPTPEMAGAVVSPVSPPPPARSAGPAAVTYAIPAVERGAGFAAYQPVPVSVQPGVPPYSTALAGVTNPQVVAALNPAQQEALEKNGFVVTPSPLTQIYQIYKLANEQGQPIFVTTDALLHTYHVLYDFALRDAEINHFMAGLTALTAEMVAQSQAQMAATEAEAQQAATRNLAYFSLAASLLDPAFSPPPEVADLVAAELALIQAHAGFQPSPIFGYAEDYSQYVPRGHYTRNETFERYFQTMMWYGRFGFRLRPGEQPEQVEAGRMETRQAILIAATLGATSVNGQPALAVWERIYEPTVFFVGQADDLSVYDYLPLIRFVYGDTLNPPDLNDVARLDNFIQQATTLRPPRIVGSLVTDEEEAAVVTQGFRFMGQRFVPDAYIFQQLVYDKVGTRETPRLMPSALDVTGALASERAYDLQLNLYNQGQYENYTNQMEKLRAEFAALPPEQWSENLYWGWLYSLQPLLFPPGQGYPTFMQNPAWIDKELHTYLGSWTELKHDTILYAKQSMAVGITSVQPEPVPANGYVEPRPEVFARLAALVNQTYRGLNERNLLNNEMSGKFTGLEALLLALTEMARKELANESLSQADLDQIRGIGDTLEQLTTFSSQTEQELASEADERMAIVADVYTDPNSQQVLQEGVGDAFLIWVIAPLDGQPVLTQGGTFSYYEFTWPLADRLTDEAWQALQPRPDQPDWTTSFIVP